MKVLSLNEKKLVRWGGNGLVVFVSKEARICGWNHKTKVKVSTIEDDDGKAIVIRKS